MPGAMAVIGNTSRLATADFEFEVDFGLERAAYRCL